MLKILKFVMGAVAKEDHIPALTHFSIKKGIITGFNGVLQLSSPIDINIDICPNAKQFVKAISTCEEAISLQLNDKNKLIVQSKKFKSFVDCGVKHDFPSIVPDGQLIQLPEKFIDAVKSIEPFIIDNVTRPWASGMLFDKGSLFATDNLTLIQHWVGCNFPFPINLPHMAVKELLRINENPVYMKVTKRHVTFKYANEKQMITSLRADEWPDLNNILDKKNVQSAIPENLFQAVDKIFQFTDVNKRVFFFGDKLTTSAHWDKEGTVIELAGLPAKGCYSAQSLRLLKNIAKTVDFSSYPHACIFHGDNVRGAVIGMHYHD